MDFDIDYDKLMLFSNKHHLQFYRCWTDLRNKFEVLRAKRSIKAQYSVQWHDIERLKTTEERATELLTKAYATNVFDILIEALKMVDNSLAKKLEEFIMGKQEKSDKKDKGDGVAMLDLCPSFFKQVCVACSPKWEDIAWQMGYKDADDRLCFQNRSIPMEEVFKDHWSVTGKKITVHEFISTISKMERPPNNVILLLTNNVVVSETKTNDEVFVHHKSGLCVTSMQCQDKVKRLGRDVNSPFSTRINKAVEEVDKQAIKDKESIIGLLYDKLKEQEKELEDQAKKLLSDARKKTADDEISKQNADNEQQVLMEAVKKLLKTGDILNGNAVASTSP